ncbi:MAG: formylmethanofuran dehydrogenase subunit E family protein [Deltaproteobacteria bacterium]|nr:formylmethanofuran dehydrogenase subunit E family protein [Deltaproteobacteria bacterium]
MMIGPYTFKEFVDRVKEFHGFPAPGVVLGGVMVDRALKHIPAGVLFNALAETNKCLPDAIQLLTPCTSGNNWLSIRNFGRFALALYDKDTGQGIRVVLNPLRIEEWPEIKDWYYKLKPKEEVDPEELLEAIQKGRADLLSLQEIRMRPAYLAKTKRGKRVICPQCREAYPENSQGLCLACQGDSPYL